MCCHTMLAALLLLFAGAAHAQTECLPNPNDVAGTPGHAFVNGCPLSASGLNNLAPLAQPTFTPPLTAVGNLTGSVNRPQEGAAILGASRSGYTAQQIANWVFCNCSDPVSYDAVRGIGILSPGSTIDLVNGIAGYVMSRTPMSGVFPTSVALFGMGIADVDNSSVWGMNTAISDNRGQVVTANSGRNLYNEFDLNFTSPRSTGIGLMLAGASLAQPAGSIGVDVTYLDFMSKGSVARWTYAFTSDDGATDTFARVGNKAASGANVASQDFTMVYRDSAGTAKNLTYAAQPGGGLLLANTDNTSVSLCCINLLLSEMAEPGPPPTTLAWVYADSADHKVKVKKADGTVAEWVNAPNVGGPIGGVTTLEVSELTTLGGGASLGSALTLKNQTVSALPVCGSLTKYQLYAVSDLSAPPTYRQTGLVGGGSIAGIVFCNGSAWEAH
jgi:hypothetical protein